MRLNGVDNEAQLRATIDAAVRAGVSFWPVDARGLVAQAPLGDAMQGSPGSVGMYSGTATQAVSDKFQQSQDTMYALAAECQVSVLDQTGYRVAFWMGSIMLVR